MEPILSVWTIDIPNDFNPDAEIPPPEKDVDMEIPLGVVEGDTYFYLRALEHKGGIIYASPVYVEIESG